MLFRQLFDKTSSTYTYLIAADYAKPAIIIDSVREQLPLYQQMIQEYELTLVAALETHLHADHISASGNLQKRYGCEIIMGASTAVTLPIHRVAHNETLEFEGFSLKAISTPGHTDDSFCYLMNNCVFTGDTLFIRGTGRTDFQNGSAIAAYRSIFEKLLTLPEDTLVYPGHDYCGRNVSTIAEEKRFNPRLQVNSAEEYKKLMDHINLQPPALIDKAIPANIVCGLQENF